jgi:putative ABC transport system permease protein
VSLRFSTRRFAASFRRRFPRHLPAILSLAVAVAAAGALGSLSDDVSAKMTREFRTRGFNAVALGVPAGPIASKAQELLRSEPAVERSLPVRILDAGAGSHRFTAVAFDFARAGEAVSGWRVEGRLPRGPSEAAAGQRLGEKLRLALNAPLELSTPSGPRRVRITGFVSSGEGEDEELLLHEADQPGETGPRPDAILVRLAGQGARVREEAASLERSSGLRIDVLLAISESEGRVVSRLSGLLAVLAGVVGLLGAFATTATLVGNVDRRRREIALERSLGTDAARLTRMFLSEGIAIGILGGGVGALAGLASANLLERGLFGVSLTVSARWVVLPWLAALVVAAAATIPAVNRALSVRPIEALREE